MKRRPYREAQSLQERLSDEFHRRGDQAGASDRDRETAGDHATARRDAERKQRARDLAGAAIDAVEDSSATAPDQADRRKRLLEGPGEFRSARVDRIRKTTE
jgi:hypothetical protein